MNEDNLPKEVDLATKLLNEQRLNYALTIRVQELESQLEVVKQFAGVMREMGDGDDPK